MANKQINARIITKHDTEKNWNKATFIPKEGEIIIYEPDENNTVSRFKVGDGVTILKDIPFVTDPYVKKEVGKSLSTNDYDNIAKQKVDNIPENYQYIRDGRAVIDIQAHLDQEEENKEPHLAIYYNAGDQDTSYLTEIPIANIVSSVISSGSITDEEKGFFNILDEKVYIPMGYLGKLEEEQEIALGHIIENEASTSYVFSDNIITDRTKFLINDEYNNIYWISYEEEDAYDNEGNVIGSIKNAIYNPILPNGFKTNLCEMREVVASVAAGKIVCENGNGQVTLATEPSPLCYAVTDTGGAVIKDTEVPVVIKGRTLVYCDNTVTASNLGAGVCASSNGNVRLATSSDLPQNIIGYICEIPTYSNYGRKSEIVVDGRIWIKI